MKVEIHSIESIEKLSKSPFAPRTSLISIGDSDAHPPKLEYKPEHILRLVFDDITLDEARERLELPDAVKYSDKRVIELLGNYGFFIFDDKQAERIAAFVDKYKDVTDVLICQCHYGQSRSAGCAAAISEYFYGSGTTIFSDDRYSPSKAVYHKVLEALNKYERRILKNDKN